MTANTSTPVIVYDQLGCGKSTHLPSQPEPKKFWTPKLFLDELDNLVEKLGIEKYDVLGQSWGGMLGAMHAINRPKGLRKLIIADSPASMELVSIILCRFEFFCFSESTLMVKLAGETGADGFVVG